jgi:hypothetical protein
MNTIKNGLNFVLAAMLLTAAPARAQNLAKVGGTPSGEQLTAQEQEMLAIAQEFGRQAQAIMEKWIAANEVSEDKLFARLYYPIPKTNPRMYNTDYDRLADRDIQPLDEAFVAKSASIVYANVYDLNCYNPTHNQRYAAQPTGNPAVDLINSRQKWINQNHTGMLAARNKAPFLIQRYQRDTGETLQEIAVPLYVRGKHWGNVRMAFRVAEGK